MRIFEIFAEKFFVLFGKKGGDDADNDKSSDNKISNHV
jgi:hypothetical protein